MRDKTIYETNLFVLVVLELFLDKMGCQRKHIPPHIIMLYTIVSNSFKFQFNTKYQIQILSEYIDLYTTILLDETPSCNGCLAWCILDQVWQGGHKTYLVILS